MWVLVYDLNLKEIKSCLPFLTTFTLNKFYCQAIIQAMDLTIYFLFFFVMFCRSLFVLLYFFSFGHCVVCSSSIYGLWLPRWYLQTLLTQTHKIETTSHRISNEPLIIRVMQQLVNSFLSILEWYMNHLSNFWTR